MKKVLLASAAVVFAGSAFAGDFPTRAKRPMANPPATAPFSWSSCYLGAHIGGGWSGTGFSDPTGSHIAPLGNAVNDGGAGLLGGGQIGCDYEFANNWVIGAAGDFSWADIDGQTSDPFFSGKNSDSPLSLGTRSEYIASATGRLGYAWNQFLIYGKGGAAWTHDKYAVNNWNCAFTLACYANASATRSGWTAGGGIEWAFASNWSALIEYDHYDFGTSNYTFMDPAVPGFPGTFGVKQELDVVKAGLNYRFGSFGR
jgi:outer membrane immunogenic protein